MEDIMEQEIKERHNISKSHRILDRCLTELNSQSNEERKWLEEYWMRSMKTNNHSK